MTRILFVSLLAGCGTGTAVFADKTDGSTTTFDTDTPDADTDTDTDTDVDTDTDTDADTDVVQTGDTAPVDPYAPMWIVDCDGGGDFTTIQTAIDAALSGDRIGLRACTYYERIDFIGKTLEIYGIRGSAVTIIDGQGGGTVVDVENGEGLGTRLAGVTIRGGSDSEGGAGIEVLESHLELEDVILTGNGPAESVIKSDLGFLDLSYVTITGNDVDDTGQAIRSGSGGAISADHVTIDCDGGANGIWHHNQLTLTDSTVTCVTGYAVHDYHLGADIRWMDAEITNVVATGGVSGISFLGMEFSTFVRNSGFVDSTCGITTDASHTFGYNGFWDVGTPVCGAKATNSVMTDPLLTAWPTDLHLGVGSPWIDAGDPGAAYKDANGTRNDIGIYGGELPPL